MKPMVVASGRLPCPRHGPDAFRLGTRGALGQVGQVRLGGGEACLWVGQAIGCSGLQWS